MSQKFLHQKPNIRELSHKHIPIIALLCINLVIGAFIVTDYGESWDEHLRYRYAENSINAYRGISGNLEDEKGPFFVMIAKLGGDLICSFGENCLVTDARHFVNFISFLIGLFFIYRLGFRFTNKWAAFGGALLFNTQPLLWGHAFINPKDLPFMAFFIASIDTGLSMTDSFGSSDHTNENRPPDHLKQPLISQFTKEWRLISGSKRRFFSTLSIIIIAILVLFVSQNLVRNGIENLIQDIYTNASHSFLNTIFDRIAQNKDEIPVSNYVQKTWDLYSLIRRYLTISFIVIWISAISIGLPETRKYLWHQRISPFIVAVWNKIRQPDVIVAGIFLGLTCSIRTLGPAAGGLISLYFIARYKKDSFPLLVAYWFISALVTYITWPALWDNPLESFLGSLLVASDFPWDGKVLFGGVTYSIGTHPRIYLPVLLSLQFTATALFTIAFGFVLTITKTIKSELDKMKVAILFLWFFVPVALVVIFEPNIYDNFRHFLFITPPLFIFAAIGLQSAFNSIKRPTFQAILILLLILPNIFSLIKLHPYQYVYYNLLTNGVGGAFRLYEMDYWGTSYREATEYINQTAPQNAKIIVYGAPHLVETYARADLQVEKFKKDMKFDHTLPTFAILLTRYDKDIHIFPEAENVYLVEKDGAVFAVVKMLDTND